MNNSYECSPSLILINMNFPERCPNYPLFLLKTREAFLAPIICIKLYQASPSYLKISVTM